MKYFLFTEEFPEGLDVTAEVIEAFAKAATIPARQRQAAEIRKQKQFLEFQIERLAEINLRIGRMRGEMMDPATRRDVTAAEVVRACDFIIGTATPHSHGVSFFPRAEPPADGPAPPVVPPEPADKKTRNNKGGKKK